jgi:hypothetical protein
MRGDVAQFAKSRYISACQIEGNSAAIVGFSAVTQ